MAPSFFAKRRRLVTALHLVKEPASEEKVLKRKCWPHGRDGRLDKENALTDAVVGMTRI